MEPPKKNYTMSLGAVGKSVFYRVACDCTDPDCDLTLELEANPEDGALYLYMYKKLRNSAYWGYTSDWEPFEWLRVLLNKFRMCWQIVVNGYIEENETLIIKDEEHIESLMKALDEGLLFIKWLHSQEEEDEKAKKKEKELS